MANIKSSMKRIKVNKRNQIQNGRYKSLVKTFTKQYIKALKQYEISKTEEDRKLADILLGLVYSKIDKAKKIGVFHTNTASRKKANLGKARATLDKKQKLNQTT